MQEDTIVPDAWNPMAWDRYAYVQNNPLRFTDPDGHCSAPPSERGAAIRLALFIEPQTLTAGPHTLHGDGRTFSSDSDPSASRGYIWIAVDEARSEPHMNPTGYQHVRVEPGGRSGRAVGTETEWAEPSEKNRWEVNRGEGGEITVTYDLVLGGTFEDIAPQSTA